MTRHHRGHTTRSRAVAGPSLRGVRADHAPAAHGAADGRQADAAQAVRAPVGERRPGADQHGADDGAGPLAGRHLHGRCGLRAARGRHHHLVGHGRRLRARPHERRRLARTLLRRARRDRRRRRDQREAAGGRRPGALPRGLRAAPVRARARGGLVPGHAHERRRDGALPRLLQPQDAAHRLHVGHVRPARHAPRRHGGAPRTPTPGTSAATPWTRTWSRAAGGRAARLIPVRPTTPSRYPKPEGIEDVDPEPAAGRWDTTLGEFVLDYDDVRTASDPEAALLAFLDSTYAAGAVMAGWDPAWICPGRPQEAPTGDTP